MSETTTVNNPQLSTTYSAGMTVPFDQISEPGAYICKWNGHLLRIPEDGVVAGRSPTVNFVGPEPLYATKIDGNPWIPLTKARMLASNHDLYVNF